MIHFSGECPGGNCPGFANASTAGHYAGIFSMDANERVQVANSAFMGNSEASLQDMIDVIHNGVFTAIKGSGGGSCDNGYCPVDNSSEISPGGLTEEQAQKLADYYNNGGGTQCGGASRESCYAFSMWWLCNFTDIVAEGENACVGVPTGGEVVGCLKDRYDIPSETEPTPYAVFSEPNHTGVVVGVKDDGTVITIEAAENGGDYSGWVDTPGDGRARVWVGSSNRSLDGKTFSNLDGHVDTKKLSEVIGS